LHSINNQIQADRYAMENFVVVMPDLFDNDPAPNSPNTAEVSQATIIERIKMRAAETAKSFMIDMWLARHTPEKVLPILHKVIESAKDEFADAIVSGGGIYGIGYCFGGKYCLQLAAETSDSSRPAASNDEEAAMTKQEPFIKTAAIAHGTLITSDDFNGIRSPIMMICVENDQLFPDNVRVAGEEYLAANGIEHEVHVYPGVPHGEIPVYAFLA
jgi:dienelactone hydrolase